MDVLISWSGSASHSLALALYGWLPTVLPFVEPWVSSEDIAKGRRWGQELAEKLRTCQYCVACIAPGTEREPWVNFEAGAIAKVLDESHVSPLLLGVDQRALVGLPLSQFQCTDFSEEEMLKLLRSMNSAAGELMSDLDVRRNLRNTWRTLEKEVEAIPLDEVQNDEDEEQDEEQEGVLDKGEEAVLVEVASWGELTVTALQIAQDVETSLLKTQYYLDRLVSSGYLFDRLARRGAREYGITPKGRAYVIEKDLEE
jgi:predicted transcriptional regulator